MKYSLVFIERFAPRPSFTSRDARLFLSSLGASVAYARVFVSNLLKRGKIARLRKGVYSFKFDSGLASAAFSPSYHGLQDSLSIHGLWEQETIPVIVTPLKVRQGLRVVAGGKVLVRRIARRMFFGFESVRESSGEWIRVSDVEKTLIDLVYFRQPLPPRDALEEIARRANEEKMRAYLKRAGKRTAKRVKKILGEAKAAARRSAA